MNFSFRLSQHNFCKHSEANPIFIKLILPSVWLETFEFVPDFVLLSIFWGKKKKDLYQTLFFWSALLPTEPFLQLAFLFMVMCLSFHSCLFCLKFFLKGEVWTCVCFLPHCFSLAPELFVHLLLCLYFWCPGYICCVLSQALWSF